MPATPESDFLHRLLTEDLQHHQVLGGVRVVNPFLVGIELTAD